ncbi:PilN domain-containing protein [Patescibacteria group bacterium]|nr:PilN domain-containing protein [Patescibacteria group bacterium]
MVNILPHKTQNELRFMYYARLFGTFFLVGAFVIGIGAGVLVPSYFLAQEEAEASKRYAEALKQTLSLSEGGAAGKSLPVLAEQVNVMKAYSEDAALALALERIVGAIPDNVSIRKMSFRFPSASEKIVTLNGNAATRSALIAFVDALKKDPLFKGVVVPVSDLVSDDDLPFTLTFSFAAVKP